MKKVEDKVGEENKSGSETSLPSPWGGVVVLVAVMALAGGAFVYFLSRHEPGPGWISLGAGLALLWWLPKQLPGLRERAALRRARKEARRLVKSARRGLKKQGAWMSAEARESIQTAAGKLEQVLGEDSLADIEIATKALDAHCEKHLVRKSPTREYVEQIGGAILAALLLRAFFYEAFRIPSSSMVPTLLVGDHLFVNKFVYGLRIPFTVTKLFAQLPERGSIVVFNRPGDPGGDDIIKRVIGLPGDRVVVKNRRVSICPPGTGECEPLPTRDTGTVHLNGDGDPDTVTERGPFFEFEFFEETVGEHVHGTLAMTGGWLPGTEGTWTVKPGHVFVMGDNRDNSQDSRFELDQRGGFGQVPVEYIKGRADIIWLSIGGPHGVRFERLFSLIE